MQNKASPEFFETRYLKPALSVKICYQNRHLRQKKKKKRTKLAKTNVTQSVTKFSLIVHLLPLLQFLISVP